MNQLKDAIWVAEALFSRNKVSGSSANLSLLIGDTIYITRSGSCFGNLSEKDFFRLGIDEATSEFKASKEFPLHQMMYESNPAIKAVLHTHSTFSTLVACTQALDEDGLVQIATKTPYLAMKVGDIGWVSYHKPGSQELFDDFNKSIRPDCKAYLMENHGVIVGSSDIIEAFYMLEEIEEASYNSYLVRSFK